VAIWGSLRFSNRNSVPLLTLRNDVPLHNQAGGRPRIEGEREREIFDATQELLGEIGYDRLTLDAVAARVRVSKATIYRLWGDKSALVDAAIEGSPSDGLTLPDTGTVVGDLHGLIALPGFFDTESAAVVSGLATAIHRDPERHDAIRRRLVHDGTKHVRALLERAVVRGELTDDLDIELLCSVIPAMVLFEMTYRSPGTFGAGLVQDIVETIIVPALQRHSTSNRKGPHGSSARR
jgi:AcrR family transcriptional regulator